MATTSVIPNSLPARRWLLLSALAMLGAVLFGMKGIVVKLAYHAGAGPDALLCWRLLLAAPAFALVWWWYARGTATPLTWRDLALAALWGVIGFQVASWVNFLGLLRIGAGLERIVLFVYPVLVIVGTALRDRQQPPRALLLAGAVTWCGIAIAWFHHAQLGDADSLGVLLVAVSAAIFAAFMVLSEPVARRIGAQRSMAIGMLAACVGMLAQALISVPGAQWLLPTPAAWGWAVVLALACTVVPVVLQAAGLAALGAQRIAVLSTVGPIGTLIIAWLALDESPGWLGGIGGAITIGGVLWCALTSATPTAPPARDKQP